MIFLALATSSHFPLPLYSSLRPTYKFPSQLDLAQEPSLQPSLQSTTCHFCSNLIGEQPKQQAQIQYSWNLLARKLFNLIRMSQKINRTNIMLLSWRDLIFTNQAIKPVLNFFHKIQVTEGQEKGSKISIIWF
ncbi:hypothetical protein ACJW31_12G175900 [Castanea mollissima]